MDQMRKNKNIVQDVSETSDSLHIKLLFLILLICTVFFAAGAQAQNDTAEIDKYLTPKYMSELEKGEVVMVSESYKDKEGKMRAKGLAIVIVKGSADAVFKHLTDYGKYPEFMPRMQSAKIYKKEGDIVGVEFELKIVFKKIKYNILHSVDRKKGILSLKLDKSKENDIADTSGTWYVIEKPEGKTILGHTVTLDSGLHVPKTIEDYLTKKDLPNIVLTVKKRVESKGNYVK